MQIDKMDIENDPHEGTVDNGILVHDARIDRADSFDDGE